MMIDPRDSVTLPSEKSAKNQRSDQSTKFHNGETRTLRLCLYLGTQ